MAEGLGAAVALAALPDLRTLAGTVFLAPVLSGRAFRRETQALAAMIGAGEDGLTVAGLRLPGGVTAALDGLDLRAATVTLPRALVIARPGRGPEEAFAARIATLTGHADLAVFSDYEAAVTDPTRAVVPQETWARVVSWLTEAVPAGRPKPRAIAAGRASTTLVGDGFVEEGQRFGPQGRLFGVLARPDGAVRGPTLVLANAGRDPHTGWARFGVDLCRAVARAGFPAFRIDLSGIGESDPPPDHDGGEVLYSPLHVADLASASAHLATLGVADVVLAGRCSGAYTALHAAAAIPATRGVIAINLLRVIWDPREDVAEAVTADIRPIGDVARQALDPKVALRLLRGEIDPRNLMRRVAGRIADRIAVHGPAAAGRRRAATALIAGLRERGVAVTFLSGEDDVGLAHIADAFGGLEALSSNANVDLSLVAGTDHNLTPRAARTRVIAAVTDALTRISR